MPVEMQTALRGATIAFNANSARASDAEARGNTTGGAVAAAMVADHRQVRPGLAAEPADLRRPSSPPPPEAGSVRDKIGRFTGSPVVSSHQTAATATATATAASNKAALEAVNVPRSRTPQNIAARLASERPPGRSETSGLNVDYSRIGANVALPRRQSTPAEPGRPSIPAPLPVRPRAAPVEKLIHVGKRDSAIKNSSSSKLPLASHQPTGTTARSDNPTASPKASPRLRPVTTQFAGDQSTDSSSLAGHVLLDQKPALPQRPGVARRRTPVNNDDRVAYRQLVEERRFHQSSDDLIKRAATPSNPSTSSPFQSANSSAPDLSSGMNNLNENAYADAIVASTLASSRGGFSAMNATPLHPPPVPPPRRHRSRSLLQQQKRSPAKASRSISPQKPVLLQTLRDRHKSDDEDDNGSKHLRHHRLRNPHKHHEGDRKRWRSEITDRERKRYEGVWAANKGLFIPPRGSRQRPPFFPPDASEMVLNLVVQDIWSRSRLPISALEQIWDLVDRQRIGLLTRDEFVVGMWLIDQYLKGHKIPVKVPDSVWDGVKYVAGLKPS